MAATERALSRIFQVTAYSEAELEQIASLIGFDRDFYLAEYPDIAAAGLDPLEHFLSQGINELRLPARPRSGDDRGSLEDILGFDAAFYAARYPDVAVDPHAHFLANGMRERRLPFDLADNLASERLLTGVLERLGVERSEALEAPAQYEPEHWLTVPAELLSAARRNAISAKPCRNDFWLGMAVGLLAQGRFGAAICCYNFFFNYYLPSRWLGNGQNGMIGAGRIVTTSEAITRNGELVVAPDVAPTASVPEPIFLNRSNAFATPAKMALPKPVYGVLSDVEVIGGTSLTVQGGHSVLYDYAEQGERARELQCPNIVHVAGNHCSFHVPSKTIDVDEAFSLLHDHGHNYHHWLLEVLPRYLLARQCGLGAQIPLLVAGHIAPQMREILRGVCKGEPLLVEIPRGVAARVRRLHCMTDLCVNSVHTNREPRRSDILFSPTAIQMLRDLAAPHFVNIPGKYENVLVARTNVSFRRVINRGVLQASMQALGLWSFDPGNATWVDQVRVFFNAKLIVSEAGAALANLVFCRPGANVIVLVSGHKNSNYFYLSQLASLVGARLFAFECVRLRQSHTIGVQDDMIVPIRSLCEWVTRFSTEPEFEPFQDAARGAALARTRVRGKRNRT